MGPAPPLSIDVESRNGVRRVIVRGEIDMSTADLMEHQLFGQDGTASAVMLDLRDVSFMDSTGLHTILRARAASERDGTRLVLLAVSPAARRVFEVSGVAQLLDHDAVGLLDRFTSGAAPHGNRRSGSDDRG